MLLLLLEYSLRFKWYLFAKQLIVTHQYRQDLTPRVVFKSKMMDASTSRGHDDLGNTDGPPRKRGRRSEACVSCRRRKIQCNREKPTCNRCAKSRDAIDCVYDDDLLWQAPETGPHSYGSVDASAKAHSLASGTAPFERGHGYVATSPAGTAAGGLATPASSLAVDHRRPSGTTVGATDSSLDQRARQLGRKESDKVDEDHISRSRAQIGSPTDRLKLNGKIILRGQETRTLVLHGGLLAPIMSRVCGHKTT